jgi:hypothetical protein
MRHGAIPAAVALTALLSTGCASPPPMQEKFGKVAGGHEDRSDRNVGQPAERPVRPGWTRSADGHTWLSQNV